MKANKKIMFVVALTAMLSSIGFAAVTKKNIKFVDENHKARTDITAVAIYDTGTLTLSTLYTRESGGESITNPMEVSSARTGLNQGQGEVIFCSEGTTFDMVVTVDDFSVSFLSVPATDKELLIPKMVNSDSGSDQNRAISRSNVVYLSPPASTVTNANVLIEAAMDDDTTIYLMDGLYQISGDITLTGYSNLTIEGMGPQTIIKNVGTGGFSCFLQAGEGHDITIRNLTIDNDNVGNPFDAFDKCIFINGNSADPALCYNITVEGVTALNAEAEALCFDYQYYTTVRNCITVDSAWAGITLAQCKYGNVYNNKIVRSGNSPAVVGSLCAGINVQSSPYTLVHDNWIHNPWYGGIAISTAMDAYGPSHNCSVYGNIVNGFLTGTGAGNSAGGIDVLISGGTATVLPYNIDIYSNHVNQLYLSDVQFDILDATHGAFNLTCTGTATTPFVNVEVGDKIYLDADTADQAKVADGYYFVSERDEVGQDWINLSMAHRIDCTPANMEEGDVFSVTVTLNGISSTKSYTALAGTNAQAVVEGLVAAIGAVQNATGTYPWTVITDAEDNTKLMLTATTPGDDFTVTLAVTNAGGSLTPAFTQAPYYGLNDSVSTNLTFLHGMAAAGIFIGDGKDIQIHNNFLNGKSTGGGILMASDISQVASCVIDNNGGSVRLTKTGRFSTAIVGKVAYCTFSATYTNGLYVITAATADAVTIDLAYSTAVPTAGVAFNYFDSAYAWDNVIGPNYTYKIRSLSSGGIMDFKGRPGSMPVNVTANTICGYYPRGTVFTNYGDTNALGFTLPAAKVGDEFIFIDVSNTDTADITITTNGTETVTGFDTTVAGNTDNSYGLIYLKCVVDGTWIVVYSTGTWS